MAWPYHEAAPQNSPRTLCRWPISARGIHTLSPAKRDRAFQRTFRLGVAADVDQGRAQDFPGRAAVRTVSSKLACTSDRQCREASLVSGPQATPARLADPISFIAVALR